MKRLSLAFLPRFSAKLILSGVLASSAQATTIPVTLENGNNRPLGTGYNSRSSVLLGTCVDNQLDSETTPTLPLRELPQGNFDLKLESSQESLSDKLGIAMGGRYRTGATTISAAAEFLKQSKSNAYSIAYNYVSEHLYQERMDPTRSRPLRPLPGFADIVKTRDLFFESCGDEYVRARDFASRLFVNINVSFVSKTERARFAARFGVESPVTSFAAGFESDQSSFSASNRMTVRVYQVGGDPSKIGKVLCPTKVDGTVDEECARSSKAVADCAFGDLKRCTSLIANAIAYANAQDGENFPSQIRDGANYSLTKLYTAPYVNLGKPFLPPPTRQNKTVFDALMKQLNDLFESQYALWTYSNKLYTGQAPRLSDRQKNEMEKLQNKHFKNSVRAAAAIEFCYDNGYEACVGEADRVRLFVGLADRGDIEAQQYDAIEQLTKAESFVQYCDIADDDHPEIKVTVESLRSLAIQTLKEEADRIKKGDLCRNLDEWLNSQKALNLADSPSLRIGALEPIAVLKGLTSLNLSGKSLRSIDALSQLTGLKELSLDENLIENLAPLTALTQLERLSVRNNRITQDQLNALKVLDTPNGHLTYLDARGNGEGLICPLRKADQCKVLNFANAVNVASMSENCLFKVGHQAVELGSDQILVAGGYSTDGRSIYRADMQLVSRDGCTPIPQLMSWGRAGHTMTKLLDGTILVAGGHTDKLELIDPSSLKSTLLPIKMKDPRSAHSATLLPDGRVLLVGGYMDLIDYSVRSTHISATVELYDPRTQSLDLLGKLSLPRAEHSATLLEDGRVLIVGGYSKPKMLNLVEVIDPIARTIQTLDEAISVGRVGHSAVRLADGRILIAGGYRWDQVVSSGTATSTLAAVASMEVFDPATESWRTIGETLNPARGSMQAWPLPDGRVMFVGGETEGAFFNGFTLEMKSVRTVLQIFDPLTEGLYSVGDLTKGRLLFSATPIGKRSLLVVGGAGDPGASSSVELIVYRSK